MGKQTQRASGWTRRSGSAWSPTASCTCWSAGWRCSWPSARARARPTTRARCRSWRSSRSARCWLGHRHRHVPPGRLARLEAFVGHQDKDEGSDRWKARAVSAMKAIIYAVVGNTALNVVIGAEVLQGRLHLDQDGDGRGPPGSGSWPPSGWPSSATAPTTCGRASPRSYAKHLDAEGKSGKTGKAYLMFGKVGYIGKGIAIAIVGGLILYGGLTHDPKKSGSLDQALHKLLTYPFGQVALIVVAAGIICYGLFCFARARHLSRERQVASTGECCRGRVRRRRPGPRPRWRARRDQAGTGRARRRRRRGPPRRR